MKTLLAVFILLAVCAYAADPQTPAAPAPAKDDYSEFIARSMTRDSLTECVSLMDRLIDAGEHGVADDQPDPGMLEVTTKQGLHFEFSATNIKKEAIIYYLTISRGGKEFKYSEAVKYAALFADRAGLPHPINLSEGDKPIFYGEWLIKPSTWRSMRKMMMKVRAENRAEKDVLKAFVQAVNNELEARAAVSRDQ